MDTDERTKERTELISPELRAGRSEYTQETTDRFNKLMADANAAEPHAEACVGAGAGANSSGVRRRCM